MSEERSPYETKAPPQIKIEIKKDGKVVYTCTLPLEGDHVSLDLELPAILKKQAI